MVSFTTILSNFQRYSLVGHDDKLLSADAIREPGEYLFGAKDGPERELLTKIFVPTAELSSAIQDIITEHKPLPSGYAVPGLAAILLHKGSMALEDADLSAPRTRPIITGLGMPGNMVEQLVRDLQYYNSPKPSVAQSLFHILSALLASIGRLGSEHGVFAEPLFLADFPEPRHSELPTLPAREREEEGKQQEEEEGHGQGEGQGQGEEEEASVTFEGTRAAPARPVAFAPRSSTRLVPPVGHRR